MDFEVNKGDQVLVLWSHLPAENSVFASFMETAQERVSPGGKVKSENVNRIMEISNEYPPSSFDVVLSGIIEPYSVSHSFHLLSKISEFIKPNGRLYFTQIRDEELEKNLVLCGIKKISQCTLPAERITDKVLELFPRKDPLEIYFYSCQFQNFKMGSSTRLLSLSKPSKANKVNIWNLADDDLNDVEIIDSEELLDEEDLKKPEASELRVCGTTGRRKACKDCSCGLREELDAGKTPSTKSVNSSCGSCYLGDAFRCASCPYLGMPAFKPGEKISLSDRQLKPDE